MIHKNEVAHLEEAIHGNKLKVPMIENMDEGTLKSPIPKCRLYWSFLFGVV
jgi:hypothetical protein